MPLASKDGKLYVKTEIDENDNEVQKLCTSCCGDDDPYGCCCYLDSEGNWQKEQLRASDCAQMPDSSHSPDTDCDDVECPEPPPPELGCCYVDIGDGTLQSQGRTTKRDCQASQDEVDPSIDCVWIADTEETKDQPCPDQPVYPPTPGICLYREDGLGTCTQYYVEASGGGDCGGDSPEECYENQVEPHLSGSFPPGNGAYYMYYDESDLYWEAFTVTSDEGVTTPKKFGNCVNAKQFVCGGTQGYPDDAFLADGTPLSCKEFADQVNALAPNTWENDLPATHCRPVSSEEECTESTGTFCPDLTECPDDFSAGCPDTPNRSNPLP